MTLVLGDYLGRGNFGKVYKATWNGKPVAAKQFTLRGEETLIEDEIKIHRELAHDNIIRMLGLEPYEQTMVMIMEFCDNGSLKAALQGRLLLDWHAKTRIAREAAAGLAYLHAHNVLHRDLRSSNVLLDANATVRLTDFGIPKIKTTTAAKAHGQRGEGTLRWMAPELLSIRPKYSSKSDIYALGMVLWEMAAEKVLPYKDQENNGYITEFVKGGGRETVPEGTPEDYAKWILSCWEQEPADRPEASEMESRVAIVPVVDPSNPTGVKAPAWLTEDFDASATKDADAAVKPRKTARVQFSEEPPAVRPVSIVEVDIEYGKEGDGDDEEDEDDLFPPISSEKLARLDIGKARIDLSLAKKDVAKDSSDNKAEAQSTAASIPPPVAPPTMTTTSLQASRPMHAEPSWMTGKRPSPPLAGAVPSLDAEAAAAKRAKAKALYEQLKVHPGSDEVRMSMLQESAELGCADAQNDLGWIHHKGMMGKRKSDEHGYFWVRKAAKQGHAQAQFRLAMFYGKGIGVPLNALKAFEYYRKSAESGYVDGQATVGYMYQNGIATPRDYAKALKWSQKAAERGNANAQYDVGLIYESGLGVTPDLGKAFEWFSKAASGNHEPARKKVVDLMSRMGAVQRKSAEGHTSPGHQKSAGMSFEHAFSRSKKPMSKSSMSAMGLLNYHAAPSGAGSSSWGGSQAPNEFDDYATGTDYAKIEHSLYEPEKKSNSMANLGKKK